MDFSSPGGKKSITVYVIHQVYKQHASIHQIFIKSLVYMPVVVEGNGVHRCIKKEMNSNAIIKSLDHTQKIPLASFSLK